MQAANTAAPKILEALRLIGLAPASHIDFALLGLPHELRKAAHEAAATIRPIADRLTSRKIACDLRIEMATLRSKSAHPEATTHADWTMLPPDITLQIFRWLAPEREADEDIDALGVHSDEHDAARYRKCSRVASVSRGWELGVRDWRCTQRRIVLVDPCDAAVRAISRDAMQLEELQLHASAAQAADDASGLAVTGDALRTLAACREMRRLLVRSWRRISLDDFTELIRKLPKLSELDLAGNRRPKDGSMSLFMAVFEPLQRLRLVLSPCDALWAASIGILIGGERRESLQARVKCIRCRRSPSDKDYHEAMRSSQWGCCRVCVAAEAACERHKSGDDDADEFGVRCVPGVSAWWTMVDVGTRAARRVSHDVALLARSARHAAAGVAAAAATT